MRGHFNVLKKNSIEKHIVFFLFFHITFWKGHLVVCLRYGWAFHREEDITDTNHRRTLNVCVMSHERIEPHTKITGQLLARETFGGGVVLSIFGFHPVLMFRHDRMVSF